MFEYACIMHVASHCILWVIYTPDYIAIVILSSSYVYCLLDIDDIDAREWLKPGVGVHPTPPTPAPVAEAGAKF